MRTYLDCMPCFLRQALEASRLATDDPDIHERVVRQTMLLAGNLNLELSPPQMAQRIHEIVRKTTGVKDPYAEAKRQSNQMALDLYPTLKKQIAASKNPFETALRLAIAGNIIDLGVKKEIGAKDLQRSMDAALAAPLDSLRIKELKNAVREAKMILYVADNAGEIVFDRLLIEELPMERVVLAVRGGNILNDATREDAEAAGLSSKVKVIENGSDAPATILPLCSDEFRKHFVQADVVISKGQGNYEGLSGESDKVFFLLQAKCPVVATDINCSQGQMIIYRQGA